MKHEYGGDGCCRWCTYDSFSSGDYHGECKYRPHSNPQCSYCGDTQIVCESCKEPFSDGLIPHYSKGCRGWITCTKCDPKINEKRFKYLDKGRRIDLNRLLWHTITTYGMSAIFEQLIDLLDGPSPYQRRLVADLKKAFNTYENRYNEEDNLS